MNREWMNQVSTCLVMVVAALVGLPSASAQPLDTFRFKASHNSYERGRYHLPFTRIPLWEQIMKYDAWGIELDICKKNGVLYTEHSCSDPEDPLDAMIDELRYAEIYERFTIINLQINSGTSCCESMPGPPGPDWESTLRSLFTSKLGTAAIYSVAEFRADGSRWPSLQTLLRRGKHFCITWGYGDETDLFFETRDTQAAAAGSLDVGLINRQSAALPEAESPQAGDQFLWRSYPASFEEIACDVAVDGMDLWDNANARGFNEISMNHLWCSWAWDDGTYSPLPMYVNPSVASVAEQHGTFYFPYKTYRQAFDRIHAIVPVPSEPVTIRLQAGTYLFGPTERTLQGPVELKARGGRVELRAGK